MTARDQRGGGVAREAVAGAGAQQLAEAYAGKGTQAASVDGHPDQRPGQRPVGNPPDVQGDQPDGVGIRVGRAVSTAGTAACRRLAGAGLAGYRPGPPHATSAGVPAVIRSSSA